MPNTEDYTSTFITLLGAISSYFVANTEVILLSLALAAALKAVPSLQNSFKKAYARKNPSLIKAEDCGYLGAALIGYLATAGSGELAFAIIGLVIAAVLKSVPSLLQHYLVGKVKPNERYSVWEDYLLLIVAVVPALVSYFTGRPDYVIYGLVFAFAAKSAGSLGETIEESNQKTVSAQE